MPEKDNLIELLSRAVETAGEESVAKTLLKLTEPEPSGEITIICNAGIHSIPESFIHGELYVASTGTLDASSKQSIEDAYRLILIALAVKLREKAWRKIYLVPTGPTTLALQVKLLIYNITRIATIDLFYARGDYFELDLDYRTYLASEAQGQSP
jgi:hypothetical protein